MIKIYKDLTEAFTDIGWNEVGIGQRAKYEITLSKSDRVGREELLRKFFDSEFSEWLWREQKISERFGKDFALTLERMARELVENAEYEQRRGQYIEGEIYLGKRGALMGTRQKKKFLAPEEIEMLVEWGEAVHSTKYGDNQPIGRGTQMFVEEGDGLLVLPKHKAIYVSKYFPEDRDK